MPREDCHDPELKSARDEDCELNNINEDGADPGHRKRHFTIVGNFTGGWSLARVTRRMASLLETTRPGCCDIYDQVGPAAGTTDKTSTDQNTAGSLHIVICQGWPPSPPIQRGDITFVYFFWEESLVPNSIVECLNQYDAVLVPSDVIGHALSSSGVDKPIFNIGYSPNLTPFLAARDRAAEPPRPFTFLHVSAGDARKGVDLLLNAYTQAFRRSDGVRLIIRGPSAPLIGLIEAARKAGPDVAAIVLIGEHLDSAALCALYHSADVMVLPTRGEGFCMPAAEAIAVGLPLIITDYGGHMQFCRPGVARLVRHRMEPSPVFGQSRSTWAEPDFEDLCSAMREAWAGLLHTDPAVRAEVVTSLNGQGWIRRLDNAIDEYLRIRPMGVDGAGPLPLMGRADR